MTLISTTPKLILTTTALALSALLALSGCGSADTAAPEKSVSASVEPASAETTPAPTSSAEPTLQSSQATTAASEPSANGFEVGEPFDEALWSVNVSGKVRVNVRPDRVIVDSTGLDSRSITAFTSEGKKVWTHEITDEFPENTRVWVLEDTVVIQGRVETAGTGLDKDKTTEVLTFLSQKDGSTVTESEGSTISSFGAAITKGDTSLDYLTEQGETVTVQADDAKPGGFFGGAPFWQTKNDSPASNIINTESWVLNEVPGIPAKEIFEMDVLAVANKPGVMVVQVGHGADGGSSYFAVQAKTGVATELECAAFTHTDSENDIAVVSPNGKYGVHESIWMSADEAKCYGGGDQKGVEFTAVDDEGTAYGFTKDSLGEKELVVIPMNGEPKTFDARVPVGVTNGGLAVHIDGIFTNGNGSEKIYQNATTITGNPIK